MIRNPASPLALAVVAVLVLPACTVLPTAGKEPVGASIVISRATLRGRAVRADAVRLLVTRVSGAVVTDKESSFTTDSVTIGFALVVLAPTDRFLATITLFAGTETVLTETIAFAVERHETTRRVVFKVREWQRGTDGLGPPPRDGAAIAYVPGLGGAVLTGGLDGAGQPTNAVWLFDGSGWRELRGMFGDRRHHVIVPYGPDSALVFGGVSPSLPPIVQRRTLVFDGTTWTLSTGPPSRDGTAGVYDAARNAILLFGGTSPDPARRGATTFLKDPAWRELQLPGPSARFGHAMVYDTEREAAVLIGGMSLDSTALSDVWMWGGEDEGWTEIEARPALPARAEHAAFYDPVRRAVVVIGGQRNGNILTDIWELRDEVWTELEPARQPTPSAGAVAAFLHAMDVGVLVPGRGPSGPAVGSWIYR